MKKTNIRSFRYSDRVAEILEAQEGTSLNDKFENLVLFCFDRVPALEKRVNEIKKEISAKLGMLHEFNRQSDALQRLAQDIKTAEHYINIVTRGAKLLADKYTDEGSNTK